MKSRSVKLMRLLCIPMFFLWGVAVQAQGTGTTYQIAFNLNSTGQQLPAEIGLRCQFFYQKPKGSSTYTSEVKRVPMLPVSGTQSVRVEMSINSTEAIDRYKCFVGDIEVRRIINGNPIRELWPDRRPFNKAFDGKSVLVTQGKF